MVLPREACAELDINTLTYENVETVNVDLKNLRGDLIVNCYPKVRKKGDNPTILVMEHRSTFDPFAIVYLSKIASRKVFDRFDNLTNEEKQEHSRALARPVIIVIYQVRKALDGLLGLEDMMGKKENPYYSRGALFIPTHLVDLNKYSYEMLDNPLDGILYEGKAIKDEPFVRATLIALKAATDGLLKEKIVDIVRILIGLKDDSLFYDHTTALLISYICAVIPAEQVTDVVDCLAKELERYLKPKEVNKMLIRLTDESIREAKAEAWAEAWAKGEAKGLVKSILITLENRLGADAALKTIEQKLLDLKDEEKLTGIMKRALNCQSLDDFNTDFY
jgi:hypothetical protein